MHGTILRANREIPRLFAEESNDLIRQPYRTSSGYRRR
jgi:hypothetical protein